MNRSIRTIGAILLIILMLTSSIQAVASPAPEGNRITEAALIFANAGQVDPFEPPHLDQDTMGPIASSPIAIAPLSISPSPMAPSGRPDLARSPPTGAEGRLYPSSSDHRAPARILLVDDDNSDATNTTSNFDNGGPYTMDTAHLMDTALDGLGLDHDLYVVMTNATGPSFQTMANYSTIVWMLGYEHGTSPTLTPADVNRLISFMTAGGSVWLIGHGMIGDVYSTANRTRTGNPFPADSLALRYLGIEEFVPYSGVPGTVNTTSNAVMDGTEQYATRDFFDQFGTALTETCSILRPVTGGLTVLQGDSVDEWGRSHDDEPRAVAYDSGSWRAVTSGLDIASISSATDREDLVGNVMAWLGTPTLNLPQHSVMNWRVLVEEQSPTWTTDYNDYYWAVPLVDQGTGATFSIYPPIAATVHTHEDMTVTAVFENHGATDETSVNVRLTMTSLLGVTAYDGSVNSSASSKMTGQVTFEVRPTRGGLYSLSTHITVANDARTSDDDADARIRAAEWMDDLENGTTEWSEEGAWKLSTNSKQYNTPTHGWYWSKTGTTSAAGDDLVTPTVDLRFYDTSYKHTLFPQNFNFVFFNYLFKGRMRGTGQDYVDLLFKASNMTQWSSLFKIDGNTPGENNVPGSFDNDWWRLTMGVYLGHYAGRTIDFKWTLVKRNPTSDSWWAVDDFCVWMTEEKNVPPWILEASPDVEDLDVYLGSQIDLRVFAEDPTFDPISYEWLENYEPRDDWTTNSTTITIPLNPTEDKYKVGRTLAITLIVSDDLDSNDTTWNIHIKDPPPGPVGELNEIYILEDEPTVVDFGTAEDIKWFRDRHGQDFTVTSEGSSLISVVTVQGNTLSFVNKIPNWNGYDNITLVVTDETGSSASYRVRMAVVPVNDAPRWRQVLLPDGEQDSYYSFDVTASDVDGPGEVLKYTDDTDLFDITDEGQIAFTPLNEHVGYNLFNVTVSDRKGLTDTMELQLFVANVNDPPVLRYIPPQTARQDQVFTLDISIYVEDPDLMLPPEFRDRITYRDDTTKVDTNVETGVLTWDSPTHEDWGDHYITITVTDSKGRTAQQEIRINVPVENMPPRLGVMGKQVLHQGTLYTFHVPCEDPDMERPDANEVLTFSNDHTELFTIEEHTGRIVLTPVNAQVGVWEVTITVTDSEGATDSRVVVFEVQNENDRPTLEGIDDRTLRVGVPFEYRVVATDPDLFPRLVDGLPVDPGERLTFMTDSDRITLDPSTGRLSLVPTLEDAQRGTMIVQITVVDSMNEVDQLSFKLTVSAGNEPPERPLVTGISEGDTLWTHETYYLEAFTTDPDNALEDLTFTWYSDDTIIDTGAVVVWSPGHAGPIVVRCVVTDPAIGQASTTLSVLVRSQRVPIPEIDPSLDGGMVMEGDPLEVVLGFSQGSIGPGKRFDITVTSNVSGTLVETDTDEGLTLPLEGLEQGDHRITITVSDDEEESIIWFETTVVESPKVSPGGSSSLGFPIVVILVSVVAVVFIWRRKPPEWALSSSPAD